MSEKDTALSHAVFGDPNKRKASREAAEEFPIKGRRDSAVERDSSLEKPFTPPELEKKALSKRGRPVVPREFDIPLTPMEEKFVECMMLTKSEDEAAKMAGVKPTYIRDFTRKMRSKPNVLEAIRKKIVEHQSRKPSREFLQKQLLEMAMNPMVGADTKHKVLRTLSEMQGFLQNQNAGGNFNLNFTVVAPDGTPMTGFTPPAVPKIEGPTDE